jgi:hypothetical protein
MLTIPFKRVYDGVLTLSEKPSDTSLSAAQKEEFISWINNRVREGWGYCMWPETVVVDYRAFREGWRADVTYEAGREVWYENDETYYRSLVSNNVAALSDTNSWAEITDLDVYLPQFPLDSYPIGTLIGLTREHPYKAALRYKSYSFKPASDGYWVIDDAPPLKIWAEFQMAPSRFTATAYVQGTTYQPADTVYNSTTGECYEAVYVDGNQTWLKIDFPAFLEAFVKFSAASDYHRNYGRGGDHANNMLGQAYQFLENERVRQAEQQGQYLQTVGAPLR